MDEENPSFRAQFPQAILDAVVALLCPPLPLSPDVLEPLVSAACGAFRVADERGSKLAVSPACLESVVMMCRSSGASHDNRCGCAGILAVACSEVKDAHTLQAAGISLLSCLVPAEEGVGLSAAGLDAIMDVFSDDDHYRNEVLVALNVVPRLLAFLPIFNGFIASIEAAGSLHSSVCKLAILIHVLCSGTASFGALEECCDQCCSIYRVQEALPPSLAAALSACGIYRLSLHFFVSATWIQPSCTMQFLHVGAFEAISKQSN